MSEIAALLAAETQAKATQANKQYFPFWNAAMNTTTLIRIVPDRDEDNPFAWVEKRTIRMTFGGMIHSDYNTDSDVTVTVPCPETHGLVCPITQAIRKFWNGSEEEKALARQLYRKPSFIIGAFVVSTPFAETNVPENPIRLLALNKSIFGNVKTGIMDADFEDAPWCPDGGRDFKIVKTPQGQWANYATSAFSYKARKWSDAERAAVEKWGLPNLAAELGPVPSAEQIAAMSDLYADWMAGRPFDNAKFGGFFRAYTGNTNGGGGGAGAAAASEPAPSHGSSDAVAAAAEVSAVIKSRNPVSRVVAAAD